VPSSSLIIEHVPEVRSRRFFDRHGQEWRAHEQVSSAYDRRASYSLIFESDGIARRVRCYPSDWCERSDAELAALCEAEWRRTPAEPLQRVCFFDPATAPEYLQLPASELARRLVWRDQLFTRFDVTVLLYGNEISTAVAYCLAPPSLSEELAIFETLYPGRGGIFRFAATTSD